MKRLLLLVLLLLPSVAQAQFPTIPFWDSSISGSIGYDPGYLVRYNGTVWICGTVSPTKCTQEPNAGGQWNSMAGYNAWNSGTTYQPGQLVMRQGSTFMALKQTQGNDPAGGTSPFWAGRSVAGPPSEMAVQNNSATLSATEINDAITRAPSGGIVQLACATYDVGTTPIAINKSISLQGCGGPATSGGGVFGTIITGTAGTTRINITATSAVQISNLTVFGTGSETLISGALTEGVSLRFMRLWNGGIGVDVTDAREFSIRDSIVEGQTDKALSIRGVLDPDRATVWIQNNFIVGPSPTNGNTGILLQDVSASYVSGNKVINFLTCLDVVAVLAGAHSEYHITGNALTCNQQGTGTRGTVRFLTSAAAGFGNIEIVGNYLDAIDVSPSHGGSQPTVFFNGTLNSIANLTFTGNAIRTGQLAGAGAVRGIGLISANFSGNSIDFWVTPPDASVYGFNITSSSGVIVSNTTYVRDGVVTNPYLGSNYTIIDPGGGVTITKAMLDLMSPSDGSQIYCSNCNLTTNMTFCSSGGGGVVATRIAGAWRCQ